MRNINSDLSKRLEDVSSTAIFSSLDSRKTNHISPDSVHLTVTSPPFLNIVRYAEDNWLRSWFNGIDASKIESKISSCRTVD